MSFPLGFLSLLICMGRRFLSNLVVAYDVSLLLRGNR